MTVPRCGLGLISLDGSLYALGGWVGLEIGDSVEKYDPSVGVWSRVDKVQTPRFAFGVTSYQGMILYPLNCMNYHHKDYIFQHRSLSSLHMFQYFNTGSNMRTVTTFSLTALDAKGFPSSIKFQSQFQVSFTLWVV